MLYRLSVHLLGLTIFFELLNTTYPTPFFSTSKVFMVLTLGAIGALALQHIVASGTIQIQLERQRAALYGVFALFIIYALIRTKNVNGVTTIVSYSGYFLLTILIAELPRSRRDYFAVLGYVVLAGLIWTSILVFYALMYEGRPFPMGMSPNVASRALVFAIVVLGVYYYLAARASRVVIWSIVAAFVAGVVITGSRAALLFITIFGAAYLVAGFATVSRTQLLAIPSVLVGAGVAILHFKPLSTGRLQPLVLFVRSGFDVGSLDPSGSIGTRARLLSFGLELLAENPIFGTGFGTFQSATDASSRFDTALAAHSTLNQIGAQLGLIGLLFVIFFVVLVARSLIRNWANEPQTYQIYQILFAGFVATAFLSMTYDVLRVAGFWILVGVVLGYPKTERSNAAQS